MVGRIAVLKELADKPLPSAAEMQWSKPIAIDRLEWFASAADLCRLMAWFDKQHDSAALDILAINPGVHPADDRFDYVGYKGGSESGVLNMTWLLHATSGHRYALSASWNDATHDVDVERLQRPDAGRDGFGGIARFKVGLACRTALSPSPTRGEGRQKALAGASPSRCRL